MPRLKIFRDKEYANSARNYKIFVDGQETTTIANDSSTTIEIPEGQHTIVAKVDWVSSPEINVEIDQNETKTIQVGVGKISKYLTPIPMLSVVTILVLIRQKEFLPWLGILSAPFLIALIYSFTLGRKNFLRLVLR